MSPGLVARVQAGLACALLAGAGVWLAQRNGALDAGYWIDEAISVGISSHGLTEIPATLRQDGSPPLYYLLLHLWMQLAGSGEAATRSLSLLFAVLAVPAAWWGTGAIAGRRAGAAAAAGAACCPFLTYYAHETRMCRERRRVRPLGRPRDLHTARAGPGAVSLPAGRRGLSHAARDLRRPRDHRLA
jgi:hypothetical protein